MSGFSRTFSLSGGPPGIFTNRPEYSPGPPRNITAILIDSLNTRAEDQVKVLAHILAFESG